MRRTPISQPGLQRHPLSSNSTLPESSPNADGRRRVDTRIRRSLRLLVQGLADNEVAKLMAFLRVGKDRLRCEWMIVVEGEAHVLVYGGSEPETVQGIVDNPLELRRISDTSHGLPTHVATLLRPLQYEVVIDTLLDAERKCRSRPAPVAPAAPAKRAHLIPVSTPTLLAGAGYRLRRWPAAEWVQSSRDHLRLASFLSTRHVEIGELARLANVDVARCGAAITTLIATGALDVKPPGAADPSATAAPATPARTHRAPEPGLLSRIRRKLGLSIFR